MKSASGFTLVECLVAALVLSLGVLAVVASVTAAQRLTRLGRLTSGAAEIAASRFAALSASACSAPGSGSTAAGAYQEAWSVASSGPLRAASVTVTFLHEQRARSLRFDAAFQCAP